MSCWTHGFSVPESSSMILAKEKHLRLQYREFLPAMSANLEAFCSVVLFDSLRTKNTYQQQMSTAANFLFFMLSWPEKTMLNKLRCLTSWVHFAVNVVYCNCLLINFPGRKLNSRKAREMESDKMKERKMAA